MIYIKSIFVGIVAAVAASVIWVLTIFVAGILVPFLMSRITNSAGAGAASVESGSISIAALVGFVIGFYWQFRRLSKRRLRSR